VPAPSPGGNPKHGNIDQARTKHDEVIIEVPDGENLRQHAKTIRQLMIDGMREVVPDVRIDVDYAAAPR